MAFFMCNGLHAQNITGQYYGIGNVTKDGNYSQYLTELILIQKGNTVTGEFNYYFKTSHVTSKVRGVFNSNTRLLKMQLVPVLNYKAANSLGADCPMQGYFLLRLSKVETTLSGAFEAIDAYKYTCPSIFIKLKKEILTLEEKNIMEIARAAEERTNAFDSLTAKFTPDTTSTIILETQEIPKASTKVTTGNKKIVTKPGRTTAIATTKPPAVKSPSVTSESKQVATAQINKIDSTQALAKETKPVFKVEAKLVKPKTQPIRESRKVAKNIPHNVVPDANPKVNKVLPSKATSNTLKPADSVLAADLLKRAFEESPVIEVEADSLFMALYDNGEVDGDTVALFHNRKLLLSKQELGTKPINLVIPIDTTIQEISMYAENLGTIPPNTAVCIIMAAGKRYELTLTSNFIRNGTIRFRKKTAAQIEREKRLLY
ncbi:MAG: hypothetical protein LH478_05175 [Chitinophagaceae bacterium]|nr:hypothetical protein [Chitinophagaceae bacterium]